MKTLYLMIGCVMMMGCVNKSHHPNNALQWREGKVTVFTSADSTNLRLTQTEVADWHQSTQPLETEISVFVYPQQKFQALLGIGGAVTDASAEVFAQLPAQTQQEFLNAYYSEQQGIGYSLMRTNIQSCDFSSGTYSYVSDSSTTLSSFNIEHDKQFRIPLIKRAIETAGGKMIFFASPWSPPAFMKSNKDVLKGGKLLAQYDDAWAHFYVKFINAYEAEGIPVWGISVQNEPMAVQRWESCVYTADEERDFLKNHLGPVMANAGFGEKKIIVWDHNRDLMTHRAKTIFDDPEASKYAWGIGFHWYETWAGGDMLLDNVQKVHEAYPSKNIMFTEGCVEKFDTAKLQLWANGERYGRSMINDFNNGTVGWCDWNVLLDQRGGPNHVGNYCFAPVHADVSSGKLIYTPSYYFIGHFSKFIHPGAQRLGTSSSRSNLLCTSFENVDGTIVTVVMNQSSKRIKYQLIVNEQTVELFILPHAIQSLIY